LLTFFNLGFEPISKTRVSPAAALGRHEGSWAAADGSAPIEEKKWDQQKALKADQ
jgi:hypothetical protein